MTKIFTNPKGETIVAKIQEDPKGEYGYRYSFWKVDFNLKKLISATPSYVKKVLESLSRSQDRMDLWICMRANRWV